MDSGAFPTGVPHQHSRMNSSSLSNTEDQYDLVLPFFKDVREAIDDVASVYDDEFEVVYFNAILLDDEVGRIILQDFSWVAGSITFVFLYMCFHTRSLYLGLSGILMVVSSFVPGYFFYRLILQISFFQTLHMLAVFVLLGIGADNIFIFTDAWKQFGLDPVASQDLAIRATLTFNRASLMCLATTATTFSAFMATGISTVMPIATFGIFAGSVIFCNFMLLIGVYPSTLMVWEK